MRYQIALWVAINTEIGHKWLRNQSALLNKVFGVDRI
jgi:hypothetical protein